jgi:hypothetical protein
LNKYLKRKISIILSVCLFLTIGVFADGTVIDSSEETTLTSEYPDIVKGNKGTFFAADFSGITGQWKGFDNIVPMITDPIKNEFLSFHTTAEEAANFIKLYTDEAPDGRVAVIMHHIPMIMLVRDSRTGVLWYDWSQIVADRLDEVFTYYKRIGGKEINHIVLDFELATEPWVIDAYLAQPDSFGSSDALWDAITSDERYLTEIKPELEKLGFIFCYEEGKNELQYARDVMYLHGQSGTVISDLRGGKNENYLKLNAVLSKYKNIALHEGVVKVCLKHYPNAVINDYECCVEPASDDWTNPQGIVHKYTNRTKVGNSGTLSQYGFNSIVGQRYEGFMVGYPYPEFFSTTYNSWLQELRFFQRGSTYTQGNKMIPHVGLYYWNYHDRSYGNTDYWSELVFHMAMVSSLPVIYLYTESSMPKQYESRAICSKLLHELDDVLGFEKREILMEEPTPIDSKYVLTGMNAGGKNVWRITPDMCYSKFTIDDFLYDQDKLIFKFANQFVEFPEGSFIYEPEDPTSMFGYWVISPEGTRPVEYRDENLAMWTEPDIKVGETGRNLLNEKSNKARALRYGKKEEQSENSKSQERKIFLDDNIGVVDYGRPDANIKSYRDVVED